MPTAVACTSVFDAAVAAATRLKLTLTALLFEVALAAMVPVLAIVILSWALPLPPSIPTALTEPASEMSCGLESCDRLLEGDIGAPPCAEDAACVADAATVIVPVLAMTSSPLAPTMPFALTCGLFASEDALTAIEPLLLIWSLPLPPRMPMLAAVGLTGR